MSELEKDYGSVERGLRLVQVNHTWQLSTKPEHYDFIRQVLGQQEATGLSKAALETLSIIAYRQPITRIDIDNLRGVSSNSSVQRLLDRGLIKEAGRMEAPGRPILYKTTPAFLKTCLLYTSTSLRDAFKLADDVLLQGVKSISDLISMPGLVSLDFADVKTIMKDAGLAHMGVGRASGENRAEEAAKEAILSPLLETEIDGATGVLLNITAGEDLSLFEVDRAATIAREASDEDANVIFGATIDESFGDEIQITVIATGFLPAEEVEAKKAAILNSANAAAANTTAKPETKTTSGAGEIAIPGFLSNED